jgi:hypothetical protein
MSGFLFGTALFAALFLIHVAWWRLARPVKTAHALLRGLALGLGGGVVAGPLLFALLALPYDIASHLQGLLMAAALGAAYIATYPALEVTSPTLAILDAITAEGPEGLDLRALEQRMDDSVLLAPRLADLLSEGLASLEGDCYRATDKGRSLAGFFIKLRTLMRRPIGG